MAQRYVCYAYCATWIRSLPKGINHQMLCTDCDTTEFRDPGSNFTTFQMRERKIRFCSPFSYSVTALTAAWKTLLWPYQKDGSNRFSSSLHPIFSERSGDGLPIRWAGLHGMYGCTYKAGT